MSTLSLSPAWRRRKQLAAGLLFVSPNVLGFCAFTLIPLAFSLILAFSDWDLKKHNLFHPAEHFQFVGFSNFTRLLSSPDFYRFLGNTAYLLIGLPIGIAASLSAALLLSKTNSGRGRTRVALVAAAGMVAGVSLLAAVGVGASAIVICVLSVIGGTLLLGTAVGGSVYRTLFYVPNFTSGVATYLLWKKLYNPRSGPINAGLSPVLHELGRAAQSAPALFTTVAPIICGGIAIACVGSGARRLRRLLIDRDIRPSVACIAGAMLVLPCSLIAFWLGLIALLLIGWVVVDGVRRGNHTGTASPRKRFDGLGGELVIAILLGVTVMICASLAGVLHRLPTAAAAGLHPPLWLSDYTWAKPALMIMGFWAAVGSNTMLLYLAALTNVPVELYEAADIDGAQCFARFWHVTWPQLAPTTFFVVVMGIIGGLQGGFETAKVMTDGGPAGSTTTLSYFIYTEGFQTGRLGYSSAVAWTLFLLVGVMTLLNFSLGRKYVND